MSLASIEMIYNDCYGGFRLSDNFKKIFKERYPDRILSSYSERTDKDLINLVKELGLKESSGQYADIKIGKINYPHLMPEESVLKGIGIYEYDGTETLTLNINNILFDLIEKDYFSTIAEMKNFIKNELTQIEIVEDDI